jgi:hypothetical protein
MMNLRIIVSVLFAITLNSSLHAQSYPNDREKFVKEFQKLMKDYETSETKVFIRDELPPLLLEGNSFSEEYFNKMVATCNAMETKRFKVYPDIFNYIYSISALVSNNQPRDSYEAFSSTMDKLIQNRNKKKLESFVEMTGGYFSNGMIATSSNFDWFYIGGNYGFEFDKKSTIEFENGNLICRVKSNSAATRGQIIDSLIIFNTKGSYDPALKKWQGSGGKVTWEKVDLDPKTTFAMLGGYEVSLKKSNYTADTVTLTTPYFTQTLQGQISDRAFKINREEDKIYPQFLSFEKRLLIPEILEGVDYIGGFQLKGESFVGAGTPEEPASVVIKRNDLPFIKSKGQQVYVNRKKVSVNDAATTLLFGNGDSLYHPSVQLTYDLQTEIVQMSRPKSGLGQSPFIDSYHQLDAYVERVAWKVNSDKLDFTYDFGTSRDQRQAVFESRNYFNAQVYDRLQGYSTVHPLLGIYNFSYKYDLQVMKEGEAATALGLTVEQAKPLLLDLSAKGFITYDVEGKKVIPNSKLKTFVLAKSGEVDYDNIIFRSDLRPKELKGYTDQEIKESRYLQQVDSVFKARNEERRLMKTFGSMDLSTFDLNLQAIDNVEITVEDNVVVFPEGSEVLVRKNRDFNFSGWLNAGKLELSANAAQFIYEDYKFRVFESDEALFRVRPLRKEDGVESIPMISSISGISGELFINDPSNRSGRNDDFAHYPILKTSRNSKVFYDSKDIFRGIYDSTRFYYTIYPFELDSLNDFKESNFRLEGELVSAGIFPLLSTPLRIMPDYSLGLVKDAPEEGFNLYGSDAKYDNKIVLSHNGLQGSGQIDFVHSHSISRAFTFLPDSTVGIASFRNDAIDTGIEFPPVESDEAFITYIPKQKVLKAASLPKKELMFFDDNDTRLKGTAIVTPKGMRGFGLMSFLRANMISDMYTFKRYDIDADTASFNLLNDDQDLTENPMAFKTDNVKSHVSFKDRKGEFNSNEGESVVEFPVNQYICKMDKFTWFMDDDAIEMERQKDRDVAINTGVDLLGPNFFSQHPKQDTLQFKAPKATFSVKDKTIYCEKVQYLDVADARIYPDSMKVTVRKKARMDEFENAKIVANYITKYHTFVDANVKVTARRAYEGKGNYIYYDLDSNQTLVPVKEITLDTAYQTIAYGKIEKEKSFRLSPYFDYYGDIAIKAANPLISFNGATKINHECDKFDRNWMSFQAELDPKNIQIPVSNDMKDLDGNKISAGIVWRDSPIKDSIKLYPTFLSSLVQPNDPIVITASGFLQYDIGASEFQIAPKEKLISMAEPGNFIALHTQSCSMNGLGSIDLGMDYGEMAVDALGTVNYNQETDETTMNITARFTAKMEKGLFQDVAKRLNEIEGLKPMTFNTSTLEEAIVEWDGVEVADKFKSKYTIDGEAKKVPESMEKSITITGIRLKEYQGNDQQRGLITTLESASVVNMYGETVMKFVPFRAFFGQNFSGGGQGDNFAFFINIPGGRDYYFDYKMTKKDGDLKIKSGDTEFNDALNELKEDKRKSKNFLYEPTTNSVYLSKFMELFAE